MRHKTLIYTALVLATGLLVGVAIGWNARKLPRWSIRNEQASENPDSHESEHEHDEHEGGIAARLTPVEMAEFGVELATAGPGQIHTTVALPGEIVPDPDRLAHVVPRVAGITREVRKQLGDNVKAGEVLAVIQSRELADTKAAYLAALERVSLAKANYDREKKLWDQEISSEREFLHAKQAFAEAQIELRSTEQKLHALGFSHEYLAKLPDMPDQSFTNYEIVAPINGTIIQKHITLGESVKHDSEVYGVADLGVVWANLTMYQRDLAAIEEGQEVLVRADTVDYETASVIDYVNPIMEEATRTGTARVVLDNEGGRWLPGMFVTGVVGLESVAADVVVPRTALQKMEERDTVFVKTEEGLQPRDVAVGRGDAQRVEIISGLEQGEEYVAVNAFTAKAELGKGSFGDGHGH